MPGHEAPTVWANSWMVHSAGLWSRIMGEICTWKNDSHVPDFASGAKAIHCVWGRLGRRQLNWLAMVILGPPFGKEIDTKAMQDQGGLTHCPQQGEKCQSRFSAPLIAKQRNKAHTPPALHQWASHLHTHPFSCASPNSVSLCMCNSLHPLFPAESHSSHFCFQFTFHSPSYTDQSCWYILTQRERGVWNFSNCILLFISWDPCTSTNSTGSNKTKQCQQMVHHRKLNIQGKM